MSPLQTALFAAMIFGVVLLLSIALILPTVGTGATANRKMRKKINWLLNKHSDDTPSLMRDSGAVQNPPVDSRYLNHPLFNAMELTIQQAGVRMSVQRLLFTSLALAAGVFFTLYAVLNNVLIAALAAPCAALLPYLRLRLRRKRRLDRFEEQLAEALDIMARALKAGHPFNETLNFVAEEMDDPIGPEFGRLFSDINYGMPSKTAFYALMQRKLKTLSAEGRMSAWVLTVLPFVLAGMLMIVSPDYLPVLFHEPAGQRLIMIAFGLLIVGILWMRTIIRIKV